MMLLTGQFRRSLDDKLRVALPKAVRAALGETPLYAAPGLDGCLALYPEAEFAHVANRLAARSPAAQSTRNYSRLFFSQAERLVVDGQGRIRLSPTLAAWAGLNHEIMLVGVRDHLELWNAEAWESFVAQSDSSYDELAERAFGFPEAINLAPPAQATNVHDPAHESSPPRPR